MNSEAEPMPSGIISNTWIIMESSLRSPRQLENMSGTIRLSGSDSVVMRSRKFDALCQLIAWGFQQNPPVVENEPLRDLVNLALNTGMTYLSLEECA